eukprot:9935064-Prorocentrum_lima.AAC.1
MTSSLVGSEMCIRDRSKKKLLLKKKSLLKKLLLKKKLFLKKLLLKKKPVSYTHLTLPTICSV